jgi:hypothetical protein
MPFDAARRQRPYRANCVCSSRLTPWHYLTLEIFPKITFVNFLSVRFAILFRPSLLHVLKNPKAMNTSDRFGIKPCPAITGQRQQQEDGQYNPNA